LPDTTEQIQRIFATSIWLRFSEKDKAVLEELIEVILQHGLSVDPAKTLLARTIQLLKWGKPPAPDTMH